MPELLLTAKKNLTDFRYSVLVQEQQLITLSFFPRSRWWVEFFGGTVNTSNLISIGNEDDLIGLKDGLELTQTGTGN
jgi:hypothetical protein